MSETTQLTKPEPDTGNPMAILGQMDLGAIDAGKVEQLLTLQERWEDRQAAKVFGEAMANCQAEIPSVILADSKNQQTRSTYAKYDAVVKAIKPVYVRHGFTVSFGEEPCDRDGFILVVATVRHSQGHSETFRRYAPIDNLGPKGTPTKSLLHGCESSMKYMQRKLLESIFGVAEGDEVEDNDGNGPISAPVDQKQADELISLMDQMEDLETGSKARFLAAVEVTSVFDLPAAKYPQAVKSVTNKIKKLEDGE